MQAYPDSTVKLYSGVDVDWSGHVMPLFDNASQQTSYFNSKLASNAAVISPTTTIKKTGWVKLEISPAILKTCNYMSFVNPSYDNKVYYCLITDYDYINPNTSAIQYMIDPIQSYMFEVDFEPCSIDRQALNVADWTAAETNPYDPSIYALQTPENLPTTKDLEKLYTYKCTNKQTEPTVGHDWDGEYIFTSELMQSWSEGATIFKDYMYDGDNLTVFFITPIDFDKLDSEGETDTKDTWDNLMDEIKDEDLGNGYVMEPYTYALGDILGDEWREIWSYMSRPYWIVAIPTEKVSSNYDYTRTYMHRLITLLTTWNAIGQITGVYSLPRAFFNLAFVDAEGSGSSMTHDWDGQGVIQYQSAWTRKIQGSYSYNPDSHKLYTFPFSYMRMENPNGDAKEFKYEDFMEVREHSHGPKFRFIADLNTRPSVICMPYKYKYERDTDYGTIQGVDINTCANFNAEERFVYDTFPQVPFNTDAYLVFLAGQVMTVTANNTSDFQDSLAFNDTRNKVNFVGNMANQIGNVLSGAISQGADSIVQDMVPGNYSASGAAQQSGNTVSQASGIVGSWMDYSRQNNLVKSQRAQIEEANAIIKGAGKVNEGIEYGRYNDTKPAYANEIYHAGSLAGVYNYIKYTSVNDIRITHVRLRDAILQKYDLYFKTYGYNFAGTVDIPYALREIKGQTGNSNLPHWETVNGKQSTYVKTIDAHVVHAMLPVSIAWESILNGGVRWIKPSVN